MKRYYTNDKRGELVEVDSSLARELVRSGKRRPEDFQIEDLPGEPEQATVPAAPRVETPFTNYGNRVNAQAARLGSKKQKAAAIIDQGSRPLPA